MRDHALELISRVARAERFRRRMGTAAAAVLHLVAFGYPGSLLTARKLSPLAPLSSGMSGCLRSLDLASSQRAGERPAVPAHEEPTRDRQIAVWATTRPRGDFFLQHVNSVR